MTSLVLLNGCLRVDDNPLLSQARGKTAALVIVDQQAYFGRQYGLFRSNLLRLRAHLQAIQHLAQQLAQRKIGLIVRFGDTHSQLCELALKLGAEQRA